MAAIVRGPADAEVQSLKDALGAYGTAHPGSEASLYRHTSASIRLRVVDGRFAGIAKTRRHAILWDFLTQRVPEDALADVSLVLTVAPVELRSSLMNLEFEDPTPSRV